MRQQLGAVCVLGALLLTACASGGDSGTTGTKTIAAVLITTSTATIRPGESSQMAAVAVEANGTEVPNAGTATWQSSAPSIATVGGSGLVTGVAPGTTSITATIQSISGTRLITVLPAGAGAVVTMPGLSFVPFQVSIHRGEQVYFEFPREPHNVIFSKVTGAPQDIQVLANVTVPRRFDTLGDFPYDCTLHPGMSGVVKVAP